jgi:Lanthionine synthetase C-like protein
MTGSGRAVRAVPDALLRAATIRERLPVAGAGPPSPEAVARLTRWRTKPPFADERQWQSRLTADILQEERWRHAAGRRAAEILASIGTHGWQCGTPLGVQVPGLMTGLAGIGLGLLRAADRTQPGARRADTPARQIATGPGRHR